MGADWQPGDIALCIIGGKVAKTSPTVKVFPKGGAYYTVEKVGEFKLSGKVMKALWFVDAPENYGGEKVWAAFRFVKVEPPVMDEFDREIIDLYKKKEKPVDAKPKRIAAPL